MKKSGSKSITKINTQIETIKIESDSEDNPTIGKNIPYKFEEDSNQVQEIIDIEETVENLKSGSQSSISTSASRNNLNSKDNNFQDKGEVKNTMFNISQRTKRILDKINEKNKKAKLKNELNNENDNNLNKIKFIGKKIKNSGININKKSKARPIKLSMKTKEVIKKLKDVRKNRFDNIQDDKSKKTYIRKSSFSSLHVKFENLIQPSRELRLPITYKKLYDSFIALEGTLNRNYKLSTSKNYNYFSNIKSIIESYTHRTFSFSTLKQILYIVPHFYILKYVNNPSINPVFSMKEKLEKNKDLMICIPHDFKERINRNYSKDFNFLDINYFLEESNNFKPLIRNMTEREMNERKNIFKNILNNLVNQYHEKFLKEKKIKIKFNPLNQKTWHHDFDPDAQCLPIPQFELPPPPENKSIFEETINNNDIKKQLSLINKEEKKENIKTKSKDKNTIVNKFVSAEYLQKIRDKEKEKKIIKEINEYNYYHNLQNDKNKVLKYLLLQIKTLLMTHNKSMELNELSELIINSNIIFKDYFQDKQKLNQVIINFFEKNKDFININKHSVYGLIVTLENSDYVIPEDLNDIK